jgi:hypothetical protein
MNNFLIIFVFLFNKIENISFELSNISDKIIQETYVCIQICWECFGSETNDYDLVIFSCF